MEKREEMALLMEEFANSGQTQKEFNASKGIGVHKFKYWSWKLKNEKEEMPGKGNIQRHGLQEHPGNPETPG
jgi:hypothetical protein